MAYLGANKRLVMERLINPYTVWYQYLLKNYWIIEESLVIAIAYYMEQAVDIDYGYLFKNMWTKLTQETIMNKTFFSYIDPVYLFYSIFIY